MKPKANVFPSSVTNGSIGIFDSRIVRTLLSKITQTVENSWRSDIERRFMVMDSADCYQGIIYHANTVEFQCTYPPSIVSDQGVHFVSLHFMFMVILRHREWDFSETVKDLFRLTRKIAWTKFSRNDCVTSFQIALYTSETVQNWMFHWRKCLKSALFAGGRDSWEFDVSGGWQCKRRRSGCPREFWPEVIGANRGVCAWKGQGVGEAVAVSVRERR